MSITSSYSSSFQATWGEKCGIFGVYGKGFEAARLTFFGLYALQHRGQEGSGIVSSTGKHFHVHKGLGLVAHVYCEEEISKLTGHMAIGHNRYSTSKGGDNCHTQPVLQKDELVTLAHNGNLPDTTLLEAFLETRAISTDNLNDSELMAEVIRIHLQQGKTLEDAVHETYPLCIGAFSLLVMTKDKLAAVRDPCGIRPLSIGTLDGGYIFSSETCALDTIQAKHLRDVEPGEMVVIDKNGLHSYQLGQGEQKLDIFEFIYFSRPDSILLGRNVDQVRHSFGVELARESPVEADIVIPIPDSAISAAMGYAHQSGIPFYHGLIKNRYIGRTFIQPEQHLRERSVHMKLNPLKHVLVDKRVVVVDDSIVRGTTSKRIVKMLRDCGASEVHFMVGCPPYRFPDFYGIDTPEQEKLIAYNRTVPEIRDYLEADSLYYLSYEGLIKATGLSEQQFSAPSFTGVYPVDIGKRSQEVHFPEEELSSPELSPQYLFDSTYLQTQS